MSVSWRDVARKDVEYAVRSTLLWALVAVFTAFLVMALLAAEQLFQGQATVDATKALSGVAMLAQLFLPGVALVVGYRAVIGERESGSLRLLLSYPFSRRDVVLGTLVGRTAVTASGLTAAYLAATAVVALRYGLPSAGAYAGFVGASVLLGVTFAAVAVAGSAAATSRGRAMALTVGPFAGMVFFWNPLIAGLHYLVTGGLPGLHAERWYFVLKWLNPLTAFRVLARAALGERVYPVPRIPVEDVPIRAPVETVELGNRLAGPVPFYLTDWFAAVILLAWAVLPAAVAFRHFERADLG